MMLTYQDTNNDKYILYNDMYVYIYITETKKTTESIQPAITLPMSPPRDFHPDPVATSKKFRPQVVVYQGLLYYQPRQCMVFFPRKSKKNCLGDVYCLFDSHQRMGNFINLGNLLQDFSFKDIGALFNGLTKKSPKCKVLGCRGSFHSFRPTKKKLETEWETSTK